MTAQETAERIEIANWFFRGWLAAAQTPDVDPADQRLETIRRLLPGVDWKDVSPAAQSHVMALLHGYDLPALRAERERRNAAHQRGAEAWTDPALRQHGQRESYTTQDLASDLGGSVAALLKPLIVPGLIVIGVLLLARSGGK